MLPGLRLSWVILLTRTAKSGIAYDTLLTGKQWVELFARELGVKPAVQVLPVWMMGIAGIFMPVLRELKEMVYQYDRDYFFDSSKFCDRFGFKPVSPGEGIRRVVAELKSREKRQTVSD